MVLKQTIRRELLARRHALSEQAVRQASTDALARMLRLTEWESARRVHIYTSKRSWGEIDTEQLCKVLQERYPRIIIETSAIAAGAVMPKNVYDSIVVPVLGFDAAGYRLGLGKGWYDRFLATQPQAHKIGLAYSWAQVSLLPHEPHDVPLDVVVTEREVMRRTLPYGSEK